MTLGDKELNARADQSRGARDLKYVQQSSSISISVHASREGSGESTHMCRLTWIFACQCNMYQKSNVLANILS